MSIMVTNTVLVIHALINTLSVMLHRFYKLYFSVWLLLCKKEYTLSILGLNSSLEGSQLSPMEQFAHSLTESGITPDSFP